LKELGDSFNKPPIPLEININDENTILFFESFYNICCDIFNLKKNYIIEQVKTEIIRNKENITIDGNISDIEGLNNSFEKNYLDKIRVDENNIKEKINLLNPIKFEKDDDENYHINFILSFSNLRATNYDIEKGNFLTTKEVAGNIIPAIASTTAAVTGIVCLQIYTLLQTNEIKSFKNISFNLALSEFDLSTPEEKRCIKDIPKTDRSNAIKVIPNEFTVWEKIDFIGPNLKAKDIVEYFKDKYNVEIDNINFNEITLVSTLLGDEEDLEKSIEELIEENSDFQINEKTKYIQLEISGSDIDGQFDINAPKIRYCLKGNSNNYNNNFIKL